MAIKGAIFDMDGTLLDSMHVWVGITNRYLKTKNIEVTPEMERKINGMMLKELAEYFIEEYNFETTPEEVIQEINGLVEEEYFYKVQLKPGVVELLESFKNNNIKMCVATATDRYMAEAALKRCGILHYFEGLYTCTEVDANKTSPKIYDTALLKLGTDKKDTYVFEDTLIPARTAKQAGYPLVTVADKWSVRNKELIQAAADIYVESLSDIKIEDL